MQRPAHGTIGLAFLGTRALQSVCLLVTMSLAAKFISSMVEDQQAPPGPLVGVICVVCLAILYCVTTVLLYFDNQLPMLPTAGLDFVFFIALMASSIVLGKPLSYLSCKAATGNAKELVESVGSQLNKYPTSTAVAAAAETTAAAAAKIQEFVPPTPTTVVHYTTTTVANAAATVAATLAPGGTTKVVGTDGNSYTISGRSLGLAARDIVIKTPDYKSWIRNGSINECMMMKAVWGFGIALTILFVFSAIMIAFIWKSERAKAPAKKTEEA